MKIKREWRKYDLRHKRKYSIIWRSHQRNIDRCFDKIIEHPKKVVFEASVSLHQFVLRHHWAGHVCFLFIFGSFGYGIMVLGS
jgi:hypothetical protein